MIENNSHPDAPAEADRGSARIAAIIQAGRAEDSPPSLPSTEPALDETVAEIEAPLPPMDSGVAPATPLQRPDSPAAPAAPSPPSRDMLPQRPPASAPELPRRARGGAAVAADWRLDDDWQFDPEAGVYSVADKRWTLQSILKRGPLELLLQSCVCFLIAVSLPIPALILQDRLWVIAASVVSPIALFMAIRTFRRWKGRAAFADRLIDTLEGPEAPAAEPTVAPAPPGAIAVKPGDRSERSAHA